MVLAARYINRSILNSCRQSLWSAVALRIRDALPDKYQYRVWWESNPVSHGSEAAILTITLGRLGAARMKTFIFFLLLRWVVGATRPRPRDRARCKASWKSSNMPFPHLSKSGPPITAQTATIDWFPLVTSFSLVCPVESWGSNFATWFVFLKLSMTLSF